MKGRTYWTLGVLALAVVAALALGATAALGADEGRMPGEWIAPFPGGRPMPQRAPRRGNAAMMFLVNEAVNTTVTENEDGVTILLTSDKPEVAERIKAAVPERIERMRQRVAERAGAEGRRPERMRERVAERPGAEGRRPMPRMARGLGLLASPEVHVQFAPRDDGIAIVVSTDNPNLAAHLKTEVPRQIDAMRLLASTMRQRRMQAGAQLALAARQDLLRLALSDKVKVQKVELDDGVTLTFTSDDPEVAARLKKQAALQIERLDKARQEVKQRRQKRRAAAGLPGEGEARRERVRQRRQVDPEIRQLIREEIRRYMEEKEEE